MDTELIKLIDQERNRGLEKWGKTDVSPSILLNASLEELGEVAHTINHGEHFIATQQEIAETMGILSRLYDMVAVFPMQDK